MSVLSMEALRTDAELIQSYSNGEQAAIVELFERYQDKLFTSIVALVRDYHLAEDLYQDCLIKMMCNLKQGKYADQGKFLPWALRLTHNYVMDYFRRQKFRQTQMTQYKHAFAEHLNHAMEPGTDKRMIQKETSKDLMSILHQLPDDQKEVVVLRIYGELSFKDIAALTNVSINTALGRMRYALMNLKKMIAKQQLDIR
jgi:RNA polymerase sigma factor (sigma-70 family)